MEWTRRARQNWNRRWRDPELSRPGSGLRQLLSGEPTLEDDIRWGLSPDAQPTASNVRRMIRLLGSRRAQDRLYAIAHLSDMGESAVAEVPAVVPALIRALRCEGLADGENWQSVLFRAGLALSHMGNAAVPELIGTIQRDWREDRDANLGWGVTENALFEVIQALGWIGSQTGQTIDASVRSQVSSELCMVLGSLLQDQERNRVRIGLVNVTIRALGEFGGPATTSLLQDALNRWEEERSLEGVVGENVTRALFRITARMRRD